MSAYTADFFWGITYSSKDRAGLLYVAELSLPKDIWWHFRGWRRTEKTENVGNAAALGWDAFSPAQGPWHSCPSEEFQQQLPDLPKGSWWQGEVQMPRATSEHVRTHGLPTGTRAMPTFNQSVHLTHPGTTASVPQPSLSKTTSETTLKGKIPTPRPLWAGKELIPCTWGTWHLP